MKHDGPYNLLIVYYTGHGRLRGSKARLELSALVSHYNCIYPPLIKHRTTATNGKNKDPYPATAFWDDAENPLRDSAEADVLAILDCCFASNAQKGFIEERRCYELLAASPMNQMTRAPGPDSFTTALIKSLKELLEEYKDRNFTTTKLQDKMNRDRDTPAMLWDRLDKHERHVQLAPLDKATVKVKEKSFECAEPEKAWVKLRFSLKEPQLLQRQVEELARRLPTAFEEAKIALRRIDWIKMDSAASWSKEAASAHPTLPGLVTSMAAGYRWRRRSQNSLRSSSGSHPGSSPTFKRRRMSLSDQTAQPGGRSSSSEETMISPVSVEISEPKSEPFSDID